MIFDPAASTITFTPEGGGAAVTFAGLKDIDLPGPEVDDLDGTTRSDLGASAQKARTFKPGIRDNGEFSFQSQPSALADITNVSANVGKAGAWEINYSGVAVISFDGYIKSYEQPDAMEEQSVIDVTVKVSGDVSIAAPL